MAAITICSDFGAPQNKVWHCFHCLISGRTRSGATCRLHSPCSTWLLEKQDWRGFWWILPTGRELCLLQDPPYAPVKEKRCAFPGRNWSKMMNGKISKFQNWEQGLTHVYSGTFLSHQSWAQKLSLNWRIDKGITKMWSGTQWDVTQPF